MKILSVLFLYVLAQNSFAADRSPVTGLTVGDGEISWADSQGWMQVQDMETFRVVEQCEGYITSCTVANGGVYQVIDHSNQRISTKIRPSERYSSGSYSQCTVNYSFPNDGAWYQLQETDSYSTVCQSSGAAGLEPPCSLDSGFYQLVEFRNGSATADTEELSCDTSTAQPQAQSAQPQLQLTQAQAQSAQPQSQESQPKVFDVTGFTELPVVPGVGYGSYNDSMWETMMRDPRKNWGLSNANIRTAVVNGRNAHIHRLKPTPDSNSAGTDRVAASFDISRRTEATLVQWIRMEPDYAMGRKQQSGKWGFGLVGGSGPTGGSNATDGFSVRLSPFGDHTQPDTEADVEMHLYVYSADKTNPRYGDRFRLVDPDTNKPFLMPRDGSWVQFAMYAKMNSSAGARDGILRGYVNGKLMFEQTGKQWFGSSRSGEPHIDKILVTTFMGGNTGDWAPTKVNEVMFADMSLGFRDK